jgi:predicted alpha/beta superfamily hydrolase
MLNQAANRCSGRVVFEGMVNSHILQTNRMIRIYLPPSYEREPKRRYPVLYLHDGQNAFSTVGTNVAFGWGSWQLDKTVDDYSAAGKMREIILVGIDCTAERYLDYRGPAYAYQKSELEGMKRPPVAVGDNSRFERYSRFLREEIKPKIDREYRTLAGPADTGLMGSSMGGICSLALAWEHPGVFGRAASLSGAFQVERKHFLTNVLHAYRGKRKPVRIYLDSGVVDFTGGDDGRKETGAVAEELRRIGWREGLDLLHYVDQSTLNEAELERIGLRRDKWKEAQTSQHNEFYWRLRVWRALAFLFPNE